MNELATRNGQVPAAVEPLPEAIERALIVGDVGKLAPEQRLAYYNARCKAAGLNPVTRPFEYIQLSGRLTLYATKSCTDSLAGMHGLSHRILSRETVGDVHEVVVEVSSPSGRSTQDLGAVVVGRLQGEPLANARMKAVTKAKRRATLSFCGLGDVSDESELDTVRNVERCDADGNPLGQAHHAKHFDNKSGHGSGAYADPQTVKAYGEWLSAFVDDVNSKWLDRHTDRGGLITPGVGDLLGTWQVSGHMLKWAKSNDLVHAPEEHRAGQRDKFAALAWQRHREDFEAEARRYGHEKWREAFAQLKATDAELGEDVNTNSDSDSDVWPEGRE